jgi:hypothetical protein
LEDLAMTTLSGQPPPQQAPGVQFIPVESGRFRILADDVYAVRPLATDFGRGFQLQKLDLRGLRREGLSLFQLEHGERNSVLLHGENSRCDCMGKTASRCKRRATARCRTVAVR